MLLGAVSAVQTPRMGAFETNERRMAEFSEMMDPCFNDRNVAVLQYTQFAYTDELTRRRMSNAGTPQPGRFDEEWAKLGLVPMIMRGKADLPESSLILTSVKPGVTVGGTLQTRTMLAPFGHEEVKVVHAEEEDQSAGRLIIPKFPDGARSEEQRPSKSGRNPRRDIGQGGAVDRKNLCNRIPIKPRKKTIRLRQEGCPAWTSISSVILKTARIGWKRPLSLQTKELPRWNLRRPSWERSGTCRRAALRAILKMPNINS